LVSLCGTWMQTVGLAWLVLDLSHNNGLAIGVIFALQYGPTTLLGAWGGVVADRRDKRHIVVMTQSVQAISAAALGAVTIAGIARLWMVGAIAVVFGIATAFDTPARQAFVVEMVGEADVPNAVGLNSALFQISRLIGPALAGVTIAMIGTG